MVVFMSFPVIICLLFYVVMCAVGGIKKAPPFVLR